ncbi:hypothetical protein [Pedobacter sp. NJ-S-72]
MLIYAIIAAAAVVIAAMIVGTGGAALIALGALAGLAGAAWGAVVGALLCGQTAAKGRKWVEVPKSRMTAVQGVRQITGDCTMTCIVGGVITFDPQIKNWSQAIALGAGNYIGGLMEGMMAGAAIGMGGAALSGGAGAFFASGGARGLGQAALQFAKSAPMNVLRNIGASFGYAGAGASASTAYTTAAAAVGLRGLTAAQSGLTHYGSTGESGWGAAGKGVFGMETGMYHSVNNLTTFHNPETGAFEWQGTWQDVTGLALLLSPVHKAAEEAKGKGKGKGEEAPAQDGEPVQDGEEVVRDPNINNETTEGQQGEHATFEAEPEGPRYGERRISDELYDELRDETPTQEIRDLVNEGVQLPMADPVLPGLQITKRLHADHIVPMDKITKMEGFGELTKEQQLQVLNNPDNFIGLSESANCSKGSKTYQEWLRHKSKGIDVDPVFRNEMIQREAQIEGQLQQQIDNLNSLNLR